MRLDLLPASGLVPEPGVVGAPPEGIHRFGAAAGVAHDDLGAWVQRPWVGHEQMLDAARAPVELDVALGVEPLLPGGSDVAIRAALDDAVDLEHFLLGQRPA